MKARDDDPEEVWKELKRLSDEIHQIRKEMGFKDNFWRERLVYLTTIVGLIVTIFTLFL